MAIDILQMLDVIEEMENYIDRKRPPEEIRDQIDISYKIENQSILLFEIRPNFFLPGERLESMVAKTTFVHTTKYWKILWKRSDSKWHTYTPMPNVKTIKEFLEVVEEDACCCFWG